MKYYIKLILVASLILILGFSFIKQKQINEMNKRQHVVESVLINGFYLKPNLNYNLDKVEEKASKDNLEALAGELIFTQNFFKSIITLNKEKINNDTWQDFIKFKPENKAVNYILGLSSKISLEQKDKDALYRIKGAYYVFYNNIGNDTSISEITNITSLTASYIEFLRQIEDIVSD